MHLSGSAAVCTVSSISNLFDIMGSAQTGQQRTFRLLEGFTFVHSILAHGVAANKSTLLGQHMHVQEAKHWQGLTLVWLLQGAIRERRLQRNRQPGPVIWSLHRPRRHRVPRTGLITRCANAPDLAAPAPWLPWQCSDCGACQKHRGGRGAHAPMDASKILGVFDSSRTSSDWGSAVVSFFL